MKLGKREVDAAVCPEGKRDVMIFDDELTGFGLRVTSGGTKTFIFQYWTGSKVRRMRIGTYGDVTPTLARKLASALRGQVAGGGDPATDRRAAIEAAAVARAADELTFSKLIDQWETLRLGQHKAKYRAEAVRALRHSLAPLADVPAVQIDAIAARRAIQAIPGAAADQVKADLARNRRPRGPPAAVRGETMARRVRSYASAMCNWAVGRGLLPMNSFAGVAVEGRESPRERCLTDGELGEVWRAAGVLAWPWGAYFRFLALTLQRQSEVAGAAWPEISADMSVWELPGRRMKNGKVHLVHLSEPARAILDQARQAGPVPGEANANGRPPLIFTVTGRTLSGFSDAKERLDRAIMKARAKAAEAAGGTADPLTPWRLHDLRRTGVTNMARLGVPWEVADKVISHVQGRIQGVAAVYQRHEFLHEREAALRKWSEHVLVAAGEVTG